MRTALLILALAGVAVAQIIPSPAPPSTAATDPSQHFVAGAQYGTDTSPHWLSFAAYGKSIGKGSYSFTGIYAFATPGTKNGLTTSSTTGLAVPSMKLGFLTFYTVGGIGASQSSGSPVANTSLGLALNGGILTVAHLGKTPFTIDVLTQAMKTQNGNNIVVGIGLGYNAK